MARTPRTYAERLLAAPPNFGKISLPRVQYPAGAPITAESPESPAVSYDTRTQLWTLESALEITTLGFTVRVEPGFRTDLASVPRAVWWAIAPFELSVAAPIVHDYLYDYGYITTVQNNAEVTTQFTKADADNFLRDIARQEGVAWWRYQIAWQAVHYFGGYTPHKGEPS